MTVRERLGWIIHYARQDEAQLFWRWGRWQYSAGFFLGFGLGFSWSPGQIEATIGPYSVGATRDV